MENKELIELTEQVRQEAYDIIARMVNKISGEFKTELKKILDERIKRGELVLSSINWGCSDCVVEVINMVLVPWIESERYNIMKKQVELTATDTVQLQMIPDIPTLPIKISKNKSKK